MRRQGTSPEDQALAKALFERGRAHAQTGNYDSAIEEFIQGLGLDPDAIEAHAELREISLARKSAGGKAIGIIESIRLTRRTKDEKLNMLNAEKLLAYDPGNTDHMVSIIQNADRAGFINAVKWIRPILARATARDIGR